MNADEYARLWSGLREVWEAVDPAPPGIADRVIAGLELAGIDAEYELLQLTEWSHGLVGARSEAPADVISLRSDSLSVVLHVSPRDGLRCDLVGWVDPPQPVSVQVLQPDVQESALSDTSGRFELYGLAAGPTRLVLVIGHSGDHRDPPWFATNTLEL